MKDELSLREVINEVILFFIKFKVLIISITILGTLSVILFQKIKPAFYSTTAIATSGISEFERLRDDKEVLNQRTAINLINDLQLYLKKEDLVVLAEKLKITKLQAGNLKSIEAEQIYREDQDGKKHNTPKFTIYLSVKDNSIIPLVQNGLLNYFSSNEYITDYYNKYQLTNQQEISAIEAEVSELQKLRFSTTSKVDMSSTSILSKQGISEVQNQIIELIRRKSINKTNQSLLKPLSFIQGFSKTQMPEREVMLLGALAAFLSFLLGTLIAIFKNVHQISKK